MTSNDKIAVIWLGYIGFNTNEARLAEMNDGKNSTLEVESEKLQQVDGLTFTCDREGISDCNIYIVTVPTPIDKYKRPDLTPLVKASEIVGGLLNEGDIVTYESTVYPGAGDVQHSLADIGSPQSSDWGRFERGHGMVC